MALTLTVGTNTYVSRADATTYIEGSISAAVWTAASDTLKDQALVTACRMLERQSWAGTKTDPDQLLSWPRTGVTDKDGQEVASDEVPQFIEDAQCELALAILQDNSVASSSSSGSNISRLKAGSAEIEYFRPTTGSRFPTTVQELVGFYFAGNTGTDSAAGGIATGTCEESYFEDNNFNLNGPY